MILKHFIRNLLVGESHIESRLKYKNALLRGYMAIIAMAVGFAYMLIDYFNDLSMNIPYYIIVILLSVVTILLNRRNQFHAANLLFLITLNLLIFLFASRDHYRTGIYQFYICVSLSAFALLGFRNIRSAFLFSGISLALFLLSFWGNITLLPPILHDEAYIDLNFAINFLVAQVTSVLIVYFLIDINHRSESDLIMTTVELQKSRERNEMVVEAVNAGIYEWQHREKAVLVSPTWKKLLGYEEHELQEINMNFYFSALHPDHHEQVQRTLEEHMKSGKPFSNEVRLRTKQGEYVWFVDNGITRFDDKGQPLITVGSIINVNDRKQAEERILEQNELLVKTNKELDQFVYSVSHDLRAPLSSILGLTNVFTLTEDHAEKESLVRLINERANTLDLFIREILDYSRNTRTELKIKPVKIHHLVDEVLETLAHMNGLDKMKVEIEIPTEMEVLTDRERIKIILGNMVSNAIKYSDPGKMSFMNIRSERNGEHWSLAIRDNGVGIKKEHHERIFEMFYQAHEHSQGSGLGLYIVTEAVQRLNGNIRVESEYGKGSTFTCQFPLHSA